MSLLSSRQFPAHGPGNGHELEGNQYYAENPRSCQRAGYASLRRRDRGHKSGVSLLLYLGTHLTLIASRSRTPDAAKQAPSSPRPRHRFDVPASSLNFRRSDSARSRPCTEYPLAPEYQNSTCSQRPIAHTYYALSPPPYIASAACLRFPSWRRGSVDDGRYDGFGGGEGEEGRCGCEVWM
ncbi:hypothetical protein B0H11DRAFT_436933 [Mycena galericulata]|nr:hypothetical protein B0H11DRAFT_436933 [Mycena galericulata]